MIQTIIMIVSIVVFPLAGVSQNIKPPQEIPTYEAVEESSPIEAEAGYLVFMEQNEYDPEDPWKETSLNETYLQSAVVQIDEYGYQSINLQFNEEGGEIFAELTEQNIGKALGIFINGELISAPIVNEKITGGQAIITGNFTGNEAQELAASLNASIGKIK